jgi:hypothetical protein
MLCRLRRPGALAVVSAAVLLAAAPAQAQQPLREGAGCRKGQGSGIDDVIKAFEYLKFESPADVDMALGKGHQAVQHVPYGTVRKVGGKPTLTNVKYYPPDQIGPPEGVKSPDWIRSRFKRK